MSEDEVVEDVARESLCCGAHAETVAIWRTSLGHYQDGLGRFDNGCESDRRSERKHGLRGIYECFWDVGDYSERSRTMHVSCCHI